MALNAYLRIKGQKTGEVKGSVIQKGREGKIMVIAASHGIDSPQDSRTGMPTGSRLHKPFIITKESDKSSPVLYGMLASNERIVEWDLQFWSPTFSSPAGSGQEVQTHSVKLMNSGICSINFCMPNNKNPDLVRYVEYEQVAFTYQKIIWTWNDGGITAADDWSSPV
ncbi:MAG: type VI secretion system tube protein TssD [Cyanobacteria bacterium]|nr:type VI secretion system tube protein TssD [Cyanobacteriota bacterium]